MDKTKLRDYLRLRLSQGASKRQIARELSEMGYTKAQIANIFKRIYANNSASTSKSMPQKSSSKSKLWRRLFLLILFFTLMAFGFWLYKYKYLPSQQNTAEPKQIDANYQLFDDPNFEIILPPSWKVTDNYQPGADSVTFILPGGTIGASEASVSVYWEDKGLNTFNGRIDYQLSQIKNNGGEYQIISDATKEEGDYIIRKVELVISSVDNPDEVMHLITQTVAYKDKLYYIDAKAPQSVWTFYQEEINRILRSFAPK